MPRLRSLFPDDLPFGVSPVRNKWAVQGSHAVLLAYLSTGAVIPAGGGQQDIAEGDDWIDVRAYRRIDVQFWTRGGKPNVTAVELGLSLGFAGGPASGASGEIPDADIIDLTAPSPGNSNGYTVDISPGGAGVTVLKRSSLDATANLAVNLTNPPAGGFVKTVEVPCLPLLHWTLKANETAALGDTIECGLIFHFYRDR